MLWEKIEHELKSKKMSVYRLARIADISENTLYELKSGRVRDLRFQTMCKIADALEVSLDVFRKE